MILFGSEMNWASCVHIRIHKSITDKSEGSRRVHSRLDLLDLPDDDEIDHIPLFKVLSATIKQSSGGSLASPCVLNIKQ